MNFDELPFEIGLTAHALRMEFDRRAAPLGVTRAQWKALAWIGREPGLRQVALAEHLEIEPITLCRTIDRLEESGLVERRRDPDDRRAWRLYLTEKGKPLVGELRGLGRRLAAEAFAGLDDATLAALSDALKSVRDNMAAMTGERLSA